MFEKFVDYLDRPFEDYTITYTEHVQERMDQRGITEKEVEDALCHGVIVEDYTSQRGLPVVLVLRAELKHLHVVVHVKELEIRIDVITTYYAGSHWRKGSRRRKR